MLAGAILNLTVRRWRKAIKQIRGMYCADTAEVFPRPTWSHSAWCDDDLGGAPEPHPSTFARRSGVHDPLPLQECTEAVVPLKQHPSRLPWPIRQATDTSNCNMRPFKSIEIQTTDISLVLNETQFILWTLNYNLNDVHSPQSEIIENQWFRFLMTPWELRVTLVSIEVRHERSAPSSCGPL